MRKVRLFFPVFLSVLLVGCGKPDLFKPMAGYSPDIPEAMAKARCEAGFQADADKAIAEAKANARATQTYTHTATCSGTGAFTNCYGTSNSYDNSGAAALGAALGAALSRGSNIRKCMATYGYEVVPQ